METAQLAFNIWWFSMFGAQTVLLQPLPALRRWDLSKRYIVFLGTPVSKRGISHDQV